MAEAALYHSHYRPDIDGLRAIAVLSVLLYHVFPTYFTGGFIGVDIFFVISGYLISSILFKNLDEGEFSFLRFYRKRIQRIFPALLLVLIACLIFGYFSLFSDEYQQLAKHMVGASTFTSNFVLWHEAGYFDKAAQFKPLLHLWSLGIEEQFYLLWPLIAVLVWKLKNKGLWLMIPIILGSFILNVVTIQHHSIATFYLPFTRGWECIVGAMLAYISLSPINHSSKTITNIKSIMACLLIGLSLFLLNKTYLFPGFLALIPTACAFLLISSNGSFINRYFLSNKIMVYVGLISYPLYLWHWPILAYFNIISAKEPSLMTGVIIIIVSVVLATLTYFIEKPLRNTHAAVTKSRVLFLSMLVVGLISFALVYFQGLPNRPFVKYQKIALNDISNFESYRKAATPCEISGNEYRKFTWCMQSKPGPTTIALWGDSHADHLYAGILKNDKQNNWLFLGHTSCPPLLGVKGYFNGDDPNTCFNHNQLALNAINQNEWIHTVVLGSLGPFYINQTNYAADHKIDNTANRYHLKFKNNTKASEIFYAGLDRTVTKLEKSGKRVVIVKDIPELPFMPSQCIYRPFTTKRCSLSKDEVLHRQNEYNKLLSKLQEQHPHLKIFDSTKYLCPGLNCIVKMGPHLLYRDSHHLSVYGSTFISENLLYMINKKSFVFN